MMVFNAMSSKLPVECEDLLIFDKST